MEYNLRKNSRVAELAVSGDFTFNDHEAFRELLVNPSGLTDVDTIIVDMSKLEFIDSAAIGMLIIANDEAALRKHQFILSGAKDQVKMALDIADMKALLKIQD